MTADKILLALPSTEPATFNEFLRALDDAPERGDKEAWAELFQELDGLETMGMVEVERYQGKIDTLILTGIGAEYVRDLQRKGRV